MSSSIDSDRGSIFNAWNVFDMDAELCRNYNCCGVQLNDLHALLEHFEEVHILVSDPSGPPQIQVPFNPQRISPQIAPQQPPQHHQGHHQPHQNHLQHHQHHQQLFDTDDMELELDLDNSTHPTPATTASSRSSPSSGGQSPPHTPPTTAPLSAYPSPTTATSSALSYLQPQSQYTAHSQQYGQYQTTPYASAHTSPYTSQPPSPGSTAANQSNGTNGTAQQHPAVHIHSHLSQASHYQNNGPNVLTHPEEAFNPYARFAADYSSHMPGTQFNGSGGEEIVVGQNGVVAGSEYGVGVVNGTVGEYGQYIGQMGGIAGQGQQQGQQCIPPALLFASTTERESSRDSREGSEGARMPSPPAPNSAKLKLKVRGGASSDPNSRASSSASTPAPTPIQAQAVNPTPSHTPSHTPAPNTVPTSSLLLSKPFRCPKPNCNKSYKQANGLKYHMTHGSCNFAPPKDLEHVKDLLERKRREREVNAGVGGGNVNGLTGAALSRSASLGSLGSGPAASTSGSGGEPFLQNMPHSAYGDLGSITETELREVEREAERRVRPFACGVGDCQRRYKNMNGLRYHYQHSGDHGALGLALLAGGLHECLSGGNGVNGGGVGVNGEGKGKGKGIGGGDEREGRRRALHRTAGAGSIRGGSASVPVSRAGSVVGASRVGTPVGYASGTATPYTTTTGASTPFSPGATTPFAPAATTPFTPSYTSGVGVASNTTPPLTPLTAAVQGLGLGGGNGVQQARSQPHSPTGMGAQLYTQQQQSPQMQQQQQVGQHQLAYQAQFVELQRRQYLQAQQQAQAQAHAQVAQQQQQQHQQQQTFGQQQEGFAPQQPQEPTFVQHHHQQDFVDAHVQAQQDFVDAQAQRDFVEAQRVQAQHAQHQREFQAQQHHQQQQQFGNADMSMS
jgi:transcription factor SFP1